LFCVYAPATEILKHSLLERPNLVASFIFDNSYPSGHTTVGMAVAVAAMLVVPRRLLVPTAIGAGLFGSAFGVAVVAAGWHRPSDAVGAFLVVIAVGAAFAGAGSDLVVVVFGAAAFVAPPSVMNTANSNTVALMAADFTATTRASPLSCCATSGGVSGATAHHTVRRHQRISLRSCIK